MRGKPTSLGAGFALVAALCGGGVFLFTVWWAGRKPPPGITPLPSSGERINRVAWQSEQDALDSREGGLSTEQTEKLVSKFAVLAEEWLKVQQIIREEKEAAIAQKPNPYLVAEGGRRYGAAIWARMEDYRSRKPETIGGTYPQLEPLALKLLVPKILSDLAQSTEDIGGISSGTVVNEALGNRDYRKALQTALITTAEQYFQGDDRSIAEVLRGESTAEQISKAMQDIGAAYELRFREIGRNLVNDEEMLQFMFDCVHVITVQNLTEGYQSRHTQKVEAAQRRAEPIHGALLKIVESLPGLSQPHDMLASRFLDLMERQE